MALGIALATINPNEYVEPFYGKPLRRITDPELNNFNMDLMAIAAQYTADPIRAAIEKYQREALVLTRAVMYSAKQPYGGANALGDEITMRLLKPVDLAYTIQEIWDLDLSARTVGDIEGYQTGAAVPADDAIGEEEGNIIFGFADPSPLCAYASYQFVKGGRTYGYYTISFTPCRADSVPFMECQAPLLEFPEESVRIQMDIARAVNPSRMQAIGLHICRASAIRAATGSA